MRIGTYYYPEQWPRHQWERDFDNIARMGLQIVHMGEFAWFEMEPSPGDIRLDWLSDCVEMCRARNLAVILCTPTASPPIWLSQQFPETLPMDEHGTRGRFGGRRHYSSTSPALRGPVIRIVTALADRFGDHPSVIGWQIDNEYSGSFDQSEATHIAFRQWLRDKYGTISGLNEAWGCQFWNTYYTDFNQVLMPPGRDPKYGNPHQCLDGSRFWSWAYAQFNKLQADILRPRIGKRFVTTNFMPFHLDCDPMDMSGDLSLMSWDSYPVTGWDKNITDQTYRVADPNAIGFIHDEMASYNGRWGLMELQPGQVNWSGVPVRLFPGAVRLWIWTALAHGAEFVTTYRFRQPRFGIEMFHHGLIGHDGVTPSPGGREFVQTLQEVAKLDLSKLSEPAEDEDPDRTVGLMFDFDQLWWNTTLPQAKRWNLAAWLADWYGAINRLGLKVKILHPHRSWPAKLPLLIAPGMQMVDDELVRRWDQYAREGGHLLLTCRTALMDRRGQMWEGPTAFPILPLIGGTIEAYDGLPEDFSGKIEMGGRKYAWDIWGDQVVPNKGTRVLAKYADQFYAGSAAVTQNKLGKGVVTYCGVCAGPAFTGALVQKVVKQTTLAKQTTLLLSRVHLLRRGAYQILLNYRDKPYIAPAAKKATFIVGGRKVPAGGVAVWKYHGLPARVEWPQTRAGSPCYDRATIRLGMSSLVNKVRIGSVSYLNSKPLIYGLEKNLDLELTLEVPSQLLAGLRDERFDIALLPVIDYQRLEGLKLVPSAGIGSDGPALTVRIFSRKPIEQMRTLACDPDSHTSVALARIILAEKYGLYPELVSLAENIGDQDAAKLLIGDKVVCEPPTGMPHQLDLGEAWKSLTGMPFVFAIWTARAGVDLGDVPVRLEAAKRAGLANLEQIITHHATPFGWPPLLAMQYLTNNLKFDIGPAQLEAIRRFHQMVGRERIIPDPPRPLEIYGQS